MCGYLVRFALVAAFLANKQGLASNTSCVPFARCAFEKGFCGFTGENGALLIAQRYSLLSQHGNYVAFVQNGREYLQGETRPQLTSPALCSNGSFCVSYAYTIAESKSGLEVLTQCEEDHLTTIWEVIQFVTSVWQKVSLTLKSCPQGNTKVIFRGTPVSSGSRQVIGLDNVLIEQCHDNTISNPPSLALHVLAKRQASQATSAPGAGANLGSQSQSMSPKVGSRTLTSQTTNSTSQAPTAATSRSSSTAIVGSQLPTHPSNTTQTKTATKVGSSSSTAIVKSQLSTRPPNTIQATTATTAGFSSSTSVTNTGSSSSLSSNVSSPSSTISTQPLANNPSTGTSSSSTSAPLTSTLGTRPQTMSGMSTTQKVGVVGVSGTTKTFTQEHTNNTNNINVNSSFTTVAGNVLQTDNTSLNNFSSTSTPVSQYKSSSITLSYNLVNTTEPGTNTSESVSNEIVLNTNLSSTSANLFSSSTSSTGKVQTTSMAEEESATSKNKFIIIGCVVGALALFLVIACIVGWRRGQSSDKGNISIEHITMRRIDD